ncbi:hypothetical protein G6355_11120 [Vibrio cholerae]|uniref:DUF962 domain-containing protein n=1 Tax=Vibrio cholerae TaxID=666 RepID=A0ABD7SRA5_VIBCL|nr:hypothetical protein [Vibrio cholerae]HAU9839170.1 hypothetical protein [Vibrio cholerae O1]EGR2118972.1 hypothetical protein [Vibrio cholerae]KFE28998.1 hypothetical protein DN30_560 [Vibrio cholerae]MBY4641920.1 hypothetical protein [Vibrio cholerae]MCR9658192.1 hypothetical protein [Vibrio cholerae]
MKKITWNVSPEATNFNKTKMTAHIMGIPIILILLWILQIVLISPFSKLLALAVCGVEYYIYKKSKELGIPLTKIFIYINERKSNLRRALPSRYHKPNK